MTNVDAEQTEEFGDLPAHALESAGVHAAFQTRDLVYRSATSGLVALLGAAILGATDETLFPHDTAARLADAKRRLLQGDAPIALDLSLGEGESARTLRVTLQPGEQRGSKGILSLFVDLTEERVAAAAVKASLREITHRSNNLIAVIQGIARQTVQNSPDLAAFMESFSARLRALAGSLDLLTAGNRHGVEAHALARLQLEQLEGSAANRIRIDGPPVVFGPDAAQNLALALHELAVNAARHGALSEPSGAVSLSWRVEPEGGFNLLWQETGGPAVAAPARRGFGRAMIERIVPAALDGKAELAFEPDGVRCRISFPRRYLLDAASSATSSL